MQSMSTTVLDHIIKLNSSGQIPPAPVMVGKKIEYKMPHQTAPRRAVLESTGKTCRQSGRISGQVNLYDSFPWPIFRRMKGVPII